ncbi:DEAD/DEAH box helicase [Polyangium jinanense]|uniref:DEAD/DEAH box helicase n=1 Tax=Polyangium jinanense TaxID=2829994 RepID=A0A9X3XH01_9BACT|nr:DEAD/DEAH box helicase [Polyangium jinanense]MDC3962534.1 DEAD/DEAH box helicase [Polyangium jinanense]MDC3989355.1 DEAD/DEAH box helicase [Polyangium jinanense]
MTYAELRALVSNRDALASDPLRALRAVATFAAADAYGPESQKLLLRLLEHRSSLEKFVAPINDLVRRFGLFPYINDIEALSVADRIAVEVHRPALSTQLALPEALVFHREQAAVYYALLSGKSVILSAPTSFGKSLIIDAIVASNRYHNIVVVLPTLALVDETRRRLMRFRSNYKVITHGGQRPSDQNIYVLTQERVVDVVPGVDVDFFVIDEFYKLSPSLETEEEDARSNILNQAFYLLHQTGAQFYLLGPNIHSLTPESAEKVDCEFVRTEYSTVVTDVVVVPPGETDDERLLRLVKTLDEPTIVYCRAPGRAADVAVLLSKNVGSVALETDVAAGWVGAAFHPEWSFVEALKNGIGLHHGQIPRALAQYVVRRFNDGLLRFLVCTSTLIEGVNTKAKNIIVCDDYVGNQKLDFFTFNNIRGRSGRMFQHFVGRVFLFHAEPIRELPVVDVPVLSQRDSASTSLLLQLDEGDLSERSRERLLDYQGQDILSLDTLRNNAGIDPDLQLMLAKELRDNWGKHHWYLSWTGVPTFDQLLSLCTLLRDYPLGGRQRSAVAPKGEASLLKKLEKRKPLHELIVAQIKHTKSAEGAVNTVLKFVRNYAMFLFPKAVRALDRIQREVFAGLGHSVGDFESYVRQVENLFHDGCLIALDEYGIPLQLAMKLRSGGVRSGAELDDVLEWLRAVDPTTITTDPFELLLIREAQEGL